MNPKHRYLQLCCAAIALPAVVLIAGCAQLEATNTKSLLSAAGFRVRTPQTAQQKEIYTALPAYKVERATIKGRTFYVYKDEKAGVAYVGHEPEYQAYTRLCIEQRIAQDYQAAAMNPYWAHRWYGAWGARSIWW